MQPQFWQERWNSGQIGFHEGAPNALLRDHWRLLPPACRVLVPLAGKSVDMVFLRDRGFDVVGVELVDKACRQFFRENRLQPRVERRGPFKLYRAPGIALWQGDIFDATPRVLGRFDAIYDRAALIALAPDDRRRYVATLTRLLQPRGRILLIGLRYDQAKVDGPPWSVTANDVRALFLRDYVVEPIEIRPAKINPRLADAGAALQLDELYRLTRFDDAAAT